MKPIPAAILTIGTEVLKGSVLNTNAQFLGKELTGLGFNVVHQSSCRDVLNEIADALASSLKQAPLVILSGGLGPTPDDLTRIALAKYFRRPLRFSKEQFALIESFYRKRSKKVPSIVRREAMIPSGAMPLLNRFGIALGFCMKHRNQLIIALPGVPSELHGMFHQVVVPQILRHFQNAPEAQRQMSPLGLPNLEWPRRSSGRWGAIPLEYFFATSSARMASMCRDCALIGRTKRDLHLFP